MEKSIYSYEYSILIQLLIKARKEKCLTQGQLAERLNQTQSFISKVERGERRLDAVELRAFCNAMGIQFTDFLTEFEGNLLPDAIRRHNK